MNVREVRALLSTALSYEGFEERRLVPTKPNVWALPADEVVRFFQPHVIRRPWGFTCSGVIGLEIPELRQWLRTYKSTEENHIFRSCFAVYHIANHDDRELFAVEHDKGVPADLWAGLIKDRLERIPERLSCLIDTYRRNREELGGLAHPMTRHAWNYLLAWCNDPDPRRPIPSGLPDGSIVNGS
jgi:hypothetical protein